MSIITFVYCLPGELSNIKPMSYKEIHGNCTRPVKHGVWSGGGINTCRDFHRRMIISLYARHDSSDGETDDQLSSESGKAKTVHVWSSVTYFQV